MDSLNKQLLSFTFEEKSTTGVCVVLSKCIKSSSSLKANEHQTLFDICIRLYQENESQFITYLLDKLIVRLSWSNQNLNLDVLCKPELVKSTCNTNLLKSISRKVKRKDLVLSQTNCFHAYLINMVSSFASHGDYTIESMYEVERENIYQILKIFKCCLYVDAKHKNGEEDKLMNLFEELYHRVQQMLINTPTPLEAKDWKFVARLLKCVTRIENLMENPKAETSFGYQFINSFLTKADKQIQLCDFDLCGGPDLNDNLETTNGRVVVDKNTGRSMLLSLLDLIRMNHNLMNKNSKLQSSY